MANREENLKKINEKLEQLTDEQLDSVAGGGLLGTIFDFNTVVTNPNAVQNGIGVNVEPKNNINNNFLPR